MNFFGFDILDFYLYLLHGRVKSKRVNNRPFKNNCKKEKRILFGVL